MMLGRILISFFYVELSSFPSTTYWGGCLSSTVYFCPLFQLNRSSLLSSNSVAMKVMMYFEDVYKTHKKLYSYRSYQSPTHYAEQKESWFWHRKHEPWLQFNFFDHWINTITMFDIKHLIIKPNILFLTYVKYTVYNSTKSSTHLTRRWKMENEGVTHYFSNTIRPERCGLYLFDFITCQVKNVEWNFT